MIIITSRSRFRHNQYDIIPSQTKKSGNVVGSSSVGGEIATWRTGTWEWDGVQGGVVGSLSGT